LTNKIEYRDLLAKATEHSTLLNKIIKDGMDVSEYSDEFLIDCLNLQAEKINFEETMEWVDNYGIDLVEEIDACCDVLVTGTYLDTLVNELKLRNLPSVDVNVKRLGLMITLTNLVLSNLIKNTDNSYTTLNKALDRVIENNMSKFSTNQEEFKKWKAPKNEKLFPKSVVVDGVRYYFLVNADGKLRKPDHFVLVSLDDLLEDFAK